MPVLSICLLPNNKDSTYLSSISGDLRSIYNFPNFIPHLTIFGNVNMQEKALIDSVKNIFGRCTPTELSVNGIGDSNSYFKAISVNFKKSEKLLNLYDELKKNLHLYTDFGSRPFDPHLSLAYGNIPKAMRQDFMKKILIKSSIVFDRFCLLTPPDSDQGWHDVGNWKIIYEQYL
jgi:2'-5' RNA ligase